MKYPKASPRLNGGSHFIMQVPVVSTCHIHARDDAALAALCDESASVCELWDGTGYLLCIEEGDRYDELTREANDLIAQFATLGYSYLRLDPDGDVLPDVPKFDW